jgi:hypothetical protein
MNLKKITSLLMLVAMIVMTYTGIMLFICPPGRIAHWAQWSMLGLTKEQFGQIHTTFMVLFIVATIMHIFYNLKPMLSYMKNESKKLIIFTREMIVALVISMVFIIGTLGEITPFSSFLNLGEDIKNSWEKDYGAPPYSHAELSSLKSFTSKMGFDLEKSKKILDKNSIKYIQTQTLSTIAKNNNISPKFIYELLKQNLKSNCTKEFTGLGRKNIEEVSVELKVSTNEFLLQLKSIGIVANKDDKFKLVAEDNDVSPVDILTKLGYIKKD